MKVRLARAGEKREVIKRRQKTTGVLKREVEVRLARAGENREVIEQYQMTTGLLRREVEVRLARTGENRKVIGRHNRTTGLLRGEVEEQLPRRRDAGYVVLALRRWSCLAVTPVGYISIDLIQSRCWPQKGKLL